MYKVSIIIPFYNAEQYIPNIIDSLRNQTYSNIEIIFVNNGSSDYGKEKLLYFIHNFKNMRCIDEPKRGVNLARWKGLEESTGDYIYFCDIDDILDYHAIEMLLKPVEEWESDYVISNFYREKENGKGKYIVAPNFEIDTFESMKNYFLLDSINPLWNKLIKRELLEEEMFINTKMGEDMVISECAYLKSKKPRKINYPVYHYIHHKQSAMTNQTIDSYYDILRNIQRICQYYQKYGEYEEEKERLDFIFLRSIYGQIARLLELEKKDLQLEVYRDLKSYIENHHFQKETLKRKKFIWVSQKIFDQELLFKFYIYFMPISLGELKDFVNYLSLFTNSTKEYQIQMEIKREALFYELQKQLKKVR